MEYRLWFPSRAHFVDLLAVYVALLRIEVGLDCLVANGLDHGDGILAGIQTELGG